jgi:hypothetical protein
MGATVVAVVVSAKVAVAGCPAGAAWAVEVGAVVAVVSVRGRDNGSP